MGEEYDDGESELLVDIATVDGNVESQVVSVERLDASSSLALASTLGGGVCIVLLRVRIGGGGGCIMAVGLQSACVQFNLVVAILFEMYGRIDMGEEYDDGKSELLVDITTVDGNVEAQVVSVERLDASSSLALAPRLFFFIFASIESWKDGMMVLFSSGCSFLVSTFLSFLFPRIESSAIINNVLYQNDHG